MKNPLKEHAHLFANGKFKVMHDSEGIIYPIVSVRPSEDWDWFIHTSLKAWDSANAFTLIARPIEDMTREELREIPVFKGAGLSPRNKINWLRSEVDHLDRDDFLYLLSIGVYPFDQSHFEEGTVIDSREAL